MGYQFGFFGHDAGLTVLLLLSPAVCDGGMSHWQLVMVWKQEIVEVLKPQGIKLHLIVTRPQLHRQTVRKGIHTIQPLIHARLLVVTGATPCHPVSDVEAVVDRAREGVLHGPMDQFLQPHHDASRRYYELHPMIPDAHRVRVFRIVLEPTLGSSTLPPVIANVTVRAKRTPKLRSVGSRAAHEPARCGTIFPLYCGHVGTEVIIADEVVHIGVDVQKLCVSFTCSNNSIS
jgi:hypothetical protein